MDQEIIARARDGDTEAFAAIVEEYSSFLMAVVMPILRDPSTAEDVLQETYLQVYRSLSNYGGGSFKHWLARIASNKALDWKRKEKRRNREELTGDIEQYVNRPNGSESTEGKVIKSETINYLKAVFEQLPADYKQTLVGFYLEDKSYRTLAEEAGVSIKTVESRLYRGRKLLRQMWEG